ncbi:hypothetical protein BT96DRAFT_1103390 [Gymnopus androsaceus JB14]|uniref:Uncharacterized protein n=1 Tax=Gymnopus androsaceus JB14 TaxID=1447944 RepID=A0A6A4I8L0_9AGAR|nr:hypothetical protein BT96DRAFT_1103390 [Gymnopus androsaceus JB14]
MIFASDCAQLPPIGGERVSLYSRRKMEDVKTYSDHCAVIGKLLWHHVTYVVILCKNMRNTGESDMDVAFHQALENMRYKACTVGENKYKDEINRLGCIRFASDTQQELTVFFSDDTISPKAEKKKDSKSKNSKTSTINTISKDLQEVLWDLPPCAHDLHAPPALSLCHGMPVTSAEPG